MFTQFPRLSCRYYNNFNYIANIISLINNKNGGCNGQCIAVKMLLIICQNDEVRNDYPSAINEWSQRAETRPLNSAIRIRVQDKCWRSSFIFDVASLRHNVIHLAIPCTIIVVAAINVESNQSLTTSLYCHFNSGFGHSLDNYQLSTNWNGISVCRWTVLQTISRVCRCGDPASAAFGVKLMSIIKFWEKGDVT